jgi:expansin (peptidoglycan-binding protein)
VPRSSSSALAVTRGLTVALVIAASSVACSDDPAPAPAGGGSTLLGTPGTHREVGSGSSGSGSSGAGSTFSAAVQQGKATYYDYSSAGQVACSFDITSDTDVTALPEPDFAGSAACGACLEVSGPKGKVTVRVVDLCPDCEPGHIDLSAQAFAKIADPVQGRVPITYQAVACNVTGPMAYRVKEGSSKYWTAIQVRNHRVPVAKVEYLKNGTFTEMPRETYDYFVDTMGVGDQPNGIALRITGADGQVVTDSIPGPQAGEVFTGAAQFN